MAQIVVTAEDLNRTAGQLTAGAADVMQQFNQLKSYVDQLVAAGWQGTASRAYDETYQQWHSGTQHVHDALTSLAHMLTSAAQIYSQTESALTSQLKG
jgi:WXG100 family type VII secretion target